MSVYIKGFKMPESCADCYFFTEDCGGVCVLQRGKGCPLIPVPDHGRLVDATKLREKEFIQKGDAYAVVMSRDIEQAPTIIPEDKEDGE